MRALSVLGDKSGWEARTAKAEREAGERAAEVKELREQVMDLMVYIEGAQTVRDNPELQGGDVGTAARFGRGGRGRGRGRR